MNWAHRTVIPRGWNCTDAELAASYPCDAYQRQPFAAYVRAIDVDASRETVFRWLCQLRAAPYSYNWIDNRGWPSPRILTPGVDDLALGQRFLIFELVEFVPGQHMTGVAQPAARRLYGGITGTYQVRDVTRGRSSRIVVRLDVPAPGPLTWLRRELLAAGDTLMMRKQLLTIKTLAEGSLTSPSPSPA